MRDSAPSTGRGSAPTHTCSHVPHAFLVPVHRRAHGANIAPGRRELSAAWHATRSRHSVRTAYPLREMRPHAGAHPLRVHWAHRPGFHLGAHRSRGRASSFSSRTSAIARSHRPAPRTGIVTSGSHDVFPMIQVGWRMAFRAPQGPPAWSDRHRPSPRRLRAARVVDDATSAPAMSATNAAKDQRASMGSTSSPLRRRRRRAGRALPHVRAAYRSGMTTAGTAHTETPSVAGSPRAA